MGCIRFCGVLAVLFREWGPAHFLNWKGPMLTRIWGHERVQLQRWFWNGSTKKGFGTRETSGHGSFQVPVDEQLFIFYNMLLCSLTSPLCANPRPCFHVVTTVRWHAFAGTRIVLLENVCGGTIQELSCRELEDVFHLRLIHGATEDSGYGATKRYRGWTFG